MSHGNRCVGRGKRDMLSPGGNMHSAHVGRGESVDPSVVRTHNALFDTWFPIEELPIPASVKPDIAAIAQKVSAGMLEAFLQSPGTAALLTAMTYPARLPFYGCLKESTNPVVRSFVAGDGGFGKLAVNQRVPLFSFLFTGSCGPATTQVASQLRELYLSGIWDLPLAVPLTGIQSPTVFMEDTAIYARLHAPVLPQSWLGYDPAGKRIVARDGRIDYL